jgi:hypothetical protein
MESPCSITTLNGMPTRAHRTKKSTALISTRLARCGKPASMNSLLHVGQKCDTLRLEN